MLIFTPCNQFTVYRYLKTLTLLHTKHGNLFGVESELDYVRDQNLSSGNSTAKVGFGCLSRHSLKGGLFPKMAPIFLWKANSFQNFFDDSNALIGLEVVSVINV